MRTVHKEKQPTHVFDIDTLTSLLLSLFRELFSGKAQSVKSLVFQSSKIPIFYVNCSHMSTAQQFNSFRAFVIEHENSLQRESLKYLHRVPFFSAAFLQIYVMQNLFWFFGLQYQECFEDN